MDQSLIYLIMMLGGILMAALPFGVYMGASTLFGIDDPASSQLLVILFVATIVISFAVGVGSLSTIQRNSCGKIKNMSQIIGNAVLSTFIVILALVLAICIPGLRGIVTGLFSPSIDPLVSEAIGYSFFLFWGAMYGFVTGGYLSANCGEVEAQIPVFK